MSQYRSTSLNFEQGERGVRGVRGVHGVRGDRGDRKDTLKTRNYIKHSYYPLLF